MKKIAFYLLLHIPLTLMAQSVTKTAKDQGTVLYKGNLISLDIGETELSAGVNNLENIYGNSHDFIFGGNLTAKSAAGIGNLFSKGDLVPDATLKGYFGYYFSKGGPEGFSKKWTILRDEAQEQQDALMTTIDEQVQAAIDDIQNDTIGKAVQALFKAKTNWATFITQVEALKTGEDADNEDLDDFITTIKDYQKEIAEQEQKLATELRTLEKNQSSKCFYQFMFFISGGINATEFKRFSGVDTVNLANSFADQSFRGGRFGVGLNAALWRFTLGATYDYVETNNFALLTSKEYNLKTTNTVGSQTLTQEKKITAYSGDYAKIRINQFNLDLLYNQRLDKKAKNHLLLNAYLRVQTMSDNTKLYPNTMNCGIGAYFFQQTGKFLGGLYVELPDVNNNIEKNKPEADQNLRAPMERLTFGIVGKFTLSSLLNL